MVSNDPARDGTDGARAPLTGEGQASQRGHETPGSIATMPPVARGATSSAKELCLLLVQLKVSAALLWQLT